MGIVCTDFFEDGQPIHFRHTKIKNGDTRDLPSEKSQAFDPARRRQHLIPMPSEDGLDQLTVHAIIVDNQNFDHFSTSRTGTRGVPRLDIPQIQPNTGDAA